MTIKYLCKFNHWLQGVHFLFYLLISLFCMCVRIVYRRWSINRLKANSGPFVDSIIAHDKKLSFSQQIHICLLYLSEVFHEKSAKTTHDPELNIQRLSTSIGNKWTRSSGREPWWSLVLVWPSGVGAYGPTGGGGGCLAQQVGGLAQ